MKHCTVSVINDLSTDQRVRKVCIYLTNNGFSVTLIGRVLPNSAALQPQPFEQHRMKLLFKKGFLFYAFFNLRLFLWLLFKKNNLLVSNDLDTLLPNYLISKIKNIPLVYDSHEYFTEVPELKGRIARKVWLALEKAIFPTLKNVFTVNDSIASEYENRYGIRPIVVRNLPEAHNSIQNIDPAELDIPYHSRVIIMQGSGINVDRGGDEAVLAMKYVQNAVLLIVGSGDMINDLKKMVTENQLESKVKFIPRQTPHQLSRITAIADIGLSIDKDTNLNYRFSLPNKIFDYIQCKVPILASNLPEVRKIVEEYQVGRIMEKRSVEALAQLINLMLDENDKLRLTENLSKAAKDLIWDKNLPALNAVYSKFKSE